MFWNVKEILSYNALFNFIVGNRGSGKSYGCKKWCIEDFVKNGNEFVWVRRFDSELDDFKTAFFSDIAHEFEGVELEYKSYKFYVNGVVAGYAIPLSISQKKKSSSYPKVNKIIFDEFIIDKGSSYYLKKEVEVFLDLYETVMRMRETNIRGAFFVANAITFTNPYFIYFKVEKPKNKKMILKQGEILVQLFSNQDFINKKKNTRFGKLIDNTDYGNYSINNEFLRDSTDFIIKQPKKLRYSFTLKSGSECFGVWWCDNEGLIYVSKKYDPSCKIKYTTILENHKPNTLLLKGGGKSAIFTHFVKAFKMGNVYFDSVKTKNIVLETIKNTL